MIVGWHASHEQIPPSALLESARLAEAAGFDAGMSSDHFSPWGERQGQSGFAWSWLGAALACTSLPFGVVNAPGQRYHPAIIAQAMATLGEMFPGRLWVALGTGEASNEHITGERWPDKATRTARLAECVEIIRALLAGEEVTHRGLVTVDRARLWTLPAEPPPLIGAAVSATTAEWVGGWADGLVTVNQEPAALRRVLDAFRDGGGGEKPAYLQTHVCWAATDDEALAVAHDQWRTNVFQPPVCWDLELPAHFDEAARLVRPEDVRDSVLVSSDPSWHLDRLSELASLGFDGIWIHHVGQAQRPFLDVFGEHVVPALPEGAMNLAATADLWWKNAVIYCLDVETFCDSDGDGVGDFAGLTSKVDYLAGLGVTCIWLMPFYPTADRDDGYDVADHYAVDPRLGTFGDFTEFVRTARDRGLRVIADLVINHTSDQHRWFREARQSRESRYREFYVWHDEIPAGGPQGVVFPGQQEGVWSFDTEAGQFYLHRFYRHQPDLNVASVAVRDEIRKIVGFWLAQGLSGFRVDAVPFLLETEGIGEEMELDPHEYLRDVRAFIARRSGEAVLLGEVNLPPAEQRRYFGDEDGDELTMLFDFIGMQATFLALARSDARPIVKALGRRHPIPDEAAWACFLRNHDELTLDKLSAKERREVFDAFGPEPDMQLYGRGLRRRLPTMLGGDRRWIQMAYSLMFSLPGTPTIFYGEEIGMGENLDIDDRLAVRTPMQWSDAPSGGFSPAPPAALRRPFPSDEHFGPAAVNVEAQRVDPDSLLNWFERLIRLRKESPAIGWGSATVLDAGAPSVLALRHEWEGRTLVTVHNLARKAITVSLRVGGVEGGVLRDRLHRAPPSPVRDGCVRLKLGAHDHRWLGVDAQ